MVIIKTAPGALEHIYLTWKVNDQQKRHVSPFFVFMPPSKIPRTRIIPLDNQNVPPTSILSLRKHS